MSIPRILLIFTALAVLVVAGCAKQKPAISEDAPSRDRPPAAPREQTQLDSSNTEPTADDDDFEGFFEPNQPGEAN